MIEAILLTLFIIIGAILLIKISFFSLKAIAFFILLPFKILLAILTAAIYLILLPIKLFIILVVMLLVVFMAPIELFFIALMLACAIGLFIILNSPPLLFFTIFGIILYFYMKKKNKSKLAKG